MHGGVSLCQFTTTAGALVYVARRGNRWTVAGGALASVLGKALVYTLLGAAVILAGQQVARSAIPVIVVPARRWGR